MGNTESALKFKDRFAELYSRQDIPSDDGLWNYFIGTPADSNQVNNLISANEIRKVRDDHPENLAMLVQIVTEHLSQLLKSASFGPILEAQALSCVRVLTRLLPFIYESKHSDLRANIWKDAQSIGPSVLEIVLALSERNGFAFPAVYTGSKLWAPGIAEPIGSKPPKQFQLNRLELLQLLMALISEPVYEQPANGLEYFTKIPMTQAVPLFCSLINTSLQIQINALMEFWDERSQQLGQLSLLTVVIAAIYVPREGINVFRKLLSKVHRPEDLALLQDKITKQLGGTTPTVEIAAMFWELVQANPHFRERVLGDSTLCQTVITVVSSKRFDKADDELVRILSLVLLSLSSNESWSYEHAMSIFEVFTPFSSESIHFPVLLDILYNISPFVALSDEAQVTNFSGFIQSLSIVKNKQLLESCAPSIQLLLQQDSKFVNQLIYDIRMIKFQDPWLSGYLNAINDTKPENAEQIFKPPIKSTIEFTPIKFSWNAAKLKWYSSVLWARAYQCVNIWVQTSVSRFKVEIVADKPTLRKPKGAVDAVADFIVDLIQKKSTTSSLD